MQLKVAALRKACAEGIERAKGAQKEWDANVDVAQAEWERSWREDKLPQWREFRDHLTKALKTGGPVVGDKMPTRPKKNYSNESEPLIYQPFNRGKKLVNYGNRNWEADHNFGPRPALQISGFEALVDFLDAVADDTISTTQLERVGFRNMHKLFEAAANGMWE